jgi:formylglycine-generating enzyme required for sulfatase activity
VLAAAVIIGVIIYTGTHTNTADAQSVIAQGDFVKIEEGSFMMGSPQNENGREADEIQHEASIESFYMSAREVSVKEFRQFIEATGYQTNAEQSGGLVYRAGERAWVIKKDANWRKPYIDQADDDYPVVQISWYDAVEYCNWKSQNEGRGNAYIINGSEVTWDRTADGYRLPSEAEWEYACRAGSKSSYSTGDELAGAQVDANAPTNVGSFSPNAFGLYDMHGNIAEWCWDWYTAGPAASVSDTRVLRGGHWAHSARYARSAYRSWGNPYRGAYTVGFRLARSL